MIFSYSDPSEKKELVSCKIIVSKWNKKINDEICIPFLTYCDKKEFDAFAKIASNNNCVLSSRVSKRSYYIQIISEYLTDEPVFVKVKNFPIIVALFARLMSFDDRTLPTNFDYEHHRDFSNFFVATNGDCPLNKNLCPANYAERKVIALEELFNRYCKESDIELYERIINAQSVEAVENTTTSHGQPNQESIPTEIQDIE